MAKHYALAREAILAILTAYSGITTDDGNIGGTTLRDRNLIGKDSQKIVEKTILIMSGDADWEDKGAASFAPLTGIITLQSAVSAQIKAGTIFRILNISSIEIDVEAINTKIGTNADAAGTTTLFAWFANLLAIIAGATGLFREQADAAINELVDNTEHFVVALTTANTRYILRNLRLKSADPGAGNTITVKLYEFINSGEVNVDSFGITQANFGTYFSLMDMFGLPHIAGDSIRVSLTGALAGPITVTGQYSHGKTNV